MPEIGKPRSSDRGAVTRLYITNPSLFRRIRPKTYGLLHDTLGFVEVETRDYTHVLAAAPARTKALVDRRVNA